MANADEVLRHLRRGDRLTLEGAGTADGGTPCLNVQGIVSAKRGETEVLVPREEIVGHYVARAHLPLGYNLEWRVRREHRSTGKNLNVFAGLFPPGWSPESDPLWAPFAACVSAVADVNRAEMGGELRRKFEARGELKHGAFSLGRDGFRVKHGMVGSEECEYDRLLELAVEGTYGVMVCHRGADRGDGSARIEMTDVSDTHQRYLKGAVAVREAIKQIAAPTRGKLCAELADGRSITLPMGDAVSPEGIWRRTRLLKRELRIGTPDIVGWEYDPDWGHGVRIISERDGKMTEHQLVVPPTLGTELLSSLRPDLAGTDAGQSEVPVPWEEPAAASPTRQRRYYG